MAKINHYDVGDIWPVQFSYTVGGVATDPTLVTVKVRAPDGTVTTAGPVSGATGGSGITRASAGVYTYNVTLTAAGHWFAHTEGTGTAAAAEDHQATVDPSLFTSDAGLSTRALVSLPETKDWLQHQNIATGEDLELVRVINDVSDRMHDEAAREFKVYGTNPATRLFDADDQAVFQSTVYVGDLTSYTAVTILDRDGVLEETVSSGDIISLPRNRAPWEPIRRLRFTPDVMQLRYDNVISVAGTWGFPSVPGNVRQAVLDAIASAIDRDVENYRQDNAATVNTAAGDGGTTVQVFGGAQRLIVLPRSAQAVAWSYRDTVLL